MSYSENTPSNVKGTIIKKPSLIALAIAGTPNYYRRPQLPYVSSSNHTSIVIPANTQVNINDIGYISTSDTIISCSSFTRNGKDIYIYACAPSDSSSTKPTFVLSLDSTAPSGYTTTTSRKIGGFHCLCASVGTISGHTLSGYVAGDILPLSIWDLLHRPVSSPEGMVWVEGLNIWVDIYPTGLSNGNLVSQYGATIADGASSPMYHKYRFIEELGKIGKRPSSFTEFVVFAKGSNEGTNISGSSDPKTCGGHKDTAGRRMISNYGIEDCCGAMWYTTISVIKEPNFGNSSWNSQYNSSVDSQKYGDAYGDIYIIVSGGSWDSGSHCGSRGLTSVTELYAKDANTGCIAVSPPQIVDF